MRWALVLLLVLAGCEDDESPETNATPTPAPEAPVEPEGPPAPEPLVRGPCRVVSSADVSSDLMHFPGSTQMVFDERGGITLAKRDGELRAYRIAPDGTFATEHATVEAPFEHGLDLLELVRVGPAFVLFSTGWCPPGDDRERYCVAAQPLHLDASPRGPIHIEEVPGYPAGTRFAVFDDSVYMQRAHRDGAHGFDRYRVAPDGEIEHTALVNEGPREGGRVAVQGFAVDGERWAALTGRESQRLHVAGRDAPIELDLPPVATHAWFHLAFVGDALRLAWTNDETDPGRMIELDLEEGRPRSAVRALRPDEELHENRVLADVPRARLSEFFRYDLAGRPIGEPVALGGLRQGLAAGDGERFVAVYPTGISANNRSSYIECRAASGRPVLPPRELPPPDPDATFDGDFGCAPRPCTIRHESLRLLSLRVGRECTRRVREGGDDEDWENVDTSGDTMHIVRRAAAIEDEALTERATLLCERMSLNNGVARWAWLALHGPDGWAACETGGGFGSLFDLQVSPHETRVAQWVEGGSPEVTVRVSIADYASDAGDVSSSEDELLYICGLHEGEPVCWGSMSVSWMSEEGESGYTTTHEGAVRAEPDGHGRILYRARSGEGADGEGWVSRLACRGRGWPR